MNVIHAPSSATLIQALPNSQGHGLSRSTFGTWGNTPVAVQDRTLGGVRVGGDRISLDVTP
ncbi:hypothetical protein IFM47457_02640 [Aspergillus lentulus]|nr:hypothetical protein IFM47457_02640 [Aspergillus lentulus]